jgi:hypothetical protein
MNRREFLRSGACAVAAAGAGPWATALPSAGKALSEDPCVVLVLFGGGTRNSESITDPDHRYIPRLWNSLRPEGTLFTNVRNDGLIVHTSAAASILSGYWEHLDLAWKEPARHPTILERIREGKGFSADQCWAFVYAVILANNVYSVGTPFGRERSANVLYPPTVPRSTRDRVQELTALAGAASDPDEREEQLRGARRLLRSTARPHFEYLLTDEARQFADGFFDRWREEDGTTSHDALIAEAAKATMKHFRPRVVMVGFGEIDCAHYGNFSRYTDAIRRTDELTFDLWKSIQSDPFYRDRTYMVITPDHGRELERPGGQGFVHHSNFYTGEGADEGCRQVWALLLGPGIPKGENREERVSHLDIAPTIGRFFGLACDGMPGRVLAA